MNNTRDPVYQDFIELEEKVERFFKQEKYRSLIRLAATNGLPSIPVDFVDLIAFDGELSHLIVEEPLKYLPALDKAAYKQLQIEDPAYAAKIGEFKARIFNLPETLSPETLSPKHLGRLLQVRGVIGVDLTKGVKIRRARIVKVCLKCGTKFEATLTSKKCPRCGAKLIIKREGQAYEVQRFKMGHLVIEFNSELAGLYAQGDKVIVAGILVARRWRSVEEQLILEVLSEQSWATRWGKKVEKREKLSETVGQNHVPPSPLRPVVHFAFVSPLFSKPLLQKTQNGEIVSIKQEWRLWKAVTGVKEPPVLIYDVDGFVNPRRLEYSLIQVDRETWEKIKHEIPANIKKALLQTFGNIASLDELWAEGFIVTPVPRLRDPTVLQRINWEGLVNTIVNYGNACKDPRLIVVRKATLLRGVRQSVNPHSIIVLPPQTGKSEFYDTVGIREDKVTDKSLIGFADVDGPRPGSLHEAELPFAFDQIEESGMFSLFRYLLSLMESGRARVDNAAWPYEVRCRSTLIILANPLGSPRNDFTVILRHLSKNPALGRRFGIIFYDYDRENYKVPRIEKRERDLKGELSETISLFRAVEEYAWPEIQAIIKRAWPWLNQKNEGWMDSALRAIDDLRSQEETRGLYDFFTNFILHSNTHTRGAALYASIVENLNKIALREYEFEELIRRAEEVLDHLLEINYKSIVNIVESFEESRAEQIARVFDSLPTYMKEITSAVELLRRAIPEEQRTQLKVPVIIPLREVPYKPRTKDYFSQVILDAKKSNPLKYNNKLKTLFRFELTNDLDAVVHSFEPLEVIQPLGVLVSLGNLERLWIRKDEHETQSKDNNAMREALPEEGSKTPNSPKSPKSSRLTPRLLVCRNCVEDLKQAGRLEKVLGKTDAPGSCELCGEDGGRFWVKLKEEVANDGGGEVCELCRIREAVEEVFDPRLGGFRRVCSECSRRLRNLGGGKP